MTTRRAMTGSRKSWTLRRRRCRRPRGRRSPLPGAIRRRATRAARRRRRHLLLRRPEAAEAEAPRPCLRGRAGAGPACQVVEASGRRRFASRGASRWHRSRGCTSRRRPRRSWRTSDVPAFSTARSLCLACACHSWECALSPAPVTYTRGRCFSCLTSRSSPRRTDPGAICRAGAHASRTRRDTPPDSRSSRGGHGARRARRSRRMWPAR